METLDGIDHALVQALRTDARRSNKDLARDVGVAQSTCLERVRRLQRLGVITGFHAAIDGGKLGTPLQAMIAVRLHRHQRSGVEAFQDHLDSLGDSFHGFFLVGLGARRVTAVSVRGRRSF